MNFKNYKLVTEAEEFNLAKAVKDAEGWLKGKYEDKFNFKHIENMDMNGEKTKSYDIIVGTNTYILDLKKFDSNGDGEQDTIGFLVRPSTIDNEEDEDEL